MKILFTVLIAIMSAVFSLSSFGAFLVTQTSIGVNLDKPLTKETTLINQGDKTVRVRVDFEKPKWAKEEYYLGEQLVAYPRVVLIRPKEKVQVRIAPRIKSNLENGEYVSLLMFKELPVKNDNSQLSMLMHIGIPYYARKGKLETGIEFDALRVEKKEHAYELLGSLKNIGNYSYPLDIVMQLYKQKKLLKEKAFKQGFYRDNVVELNKSLPIDTDADHMKVIFENEQISFSETFDFTL